MLADEPFERFSTGARQLDLAKDHGFRFLRVVPGQDGPLLGRRQTLAWIDDNYLAGFSDSCSAIRRRRFSLILPGGLHGTQYR